MEIVAFCLEMRTPLLIKLHDLRFP